MSPLTKVHTFISKMSSRIRWFKFYQISSTYFWHKYWLTSKFRGWHWYCSSLINIISSHLESLNLIPGSVIVLTFHLLQYYHRADCLYCKCHWMNILPLLKNLHLWTLRLDPSICHLQLYFSLLRVHAVGERSSQLARRSLTASTETVKFWLIISCGRRTVHCQTQNFIRIKRVNLSVSAGKRHSVLQWYFVS